MNHEEAQLVARAASTADGGCSSCVKGVLYELQKDFPGFNWKALAEAYWNGELVSE